MAGWAAGEVVVRREVLNDGRCWLAVPVYVVEDTPELLATFIASGAPLAFPPGPWPIAGGVHPWSTGTAWEGHGVLMLQRPRESHAVWHFWSGPERSFSGWYLNLQAPFRRTAIGYDTQDLELDVLVDLDGSWRFKDWDLVDERVAEGRFTPTQAAVIRAEGRRIGADLDAGRRWWDPAWASWFPDPSWPVPSFPDHWESVPTS